MHSVPPFFSIIIPVYNVEKYLQRCIDSVLLQDFENYEVLLIDDGSTDNSSFICDEAVKYDDRFKVIHQQNGGQSLARNIGLKTAIGKFIVFIDSDDMIETTSLKEIFVKINLYENLDIVQIKSTVYKDNSNEYLYESKVSSVNELISGELFLIDALKSNFYTAVWNYIFRREFLINNELFFLEGVYHEDEEYTPRVFLKALFVLKLDVIHYKYYIRENSTMTKNNQTKNSVDLLYISNKLENIYSNINTQELKDLLFNRLVGLQLTSFILGKLYKKNSLSLDTKFLKRHALSKSNKLKVVIYRLNRPLLYFLETCYLRIKQILRIFSI